MELQQRTGLGAVASHERLLQRGSLRLPFCLGCVLTCEALGCHFLGATPTDIATASSGTAYGHQLCRRPAIVTCLKGGRTFAVVPTDCRLRTVESRTRDMHACMCIGKGTHLACIWTWLLARVHL